MTASFAIVVSDAQGIRCFHRAALPEQHQRAMDQIVAEALRRLQALAAPTAPAVEIKPPPPAADATLTQSEMARAKGYSGDCCPQCMMFTMKRTGTCLSCDNCGYNAGCG